MNIEICVPNSSTTKEKGDLLELLSKEMLEVQNYEVQSEVRKTGSELDLLCTHKVSGKQIYVECKAFRDKKIDAPIIRQLMGTVIIEGYSEGWLISTSELSKDAKGLHDELPNKPHTSSIVIYTPEKVIQSLQSANLICSIPKNNLQQYISSDHIGEWSLLITPFGRFWAVSILKAGIPSNVICYYAQSGKLVEDQELLDNIALTDSSLSNLDFLKIINTKKEKEPIKISDLSIEVIEVQKGEDWNDYRPARPQDFVGRTKDINELFDFFKKIREKEVNTRIFAITGNSGLGKSSLIIKLAERAKNKQQKQKIFLYAIDVRAAKSPEYIYSSLLKTLKEAQNKGFGRPDINIVITNINHPLDSKSISEYLKSIEEANQLIVLVFDQFEELFSKPELYELFNHATSILLNAASLKTNLCIGFAWKTDSTTHSEHPAYFFWHKLSDYRMVRKLTPFSDRESGAVINKFEEAIQQKIHPDLRHNLIVSSQGYPWLLKKLCIHLYEKIESGLRQEELLENKLDISSLFANDLNELNPQEIKALKFIAHRAPVDVVDTIDTCGEDIVISLLHKRLIIKSGITLNLYWDIFREFILTGNVPIIALRYLPSNDFISIWNVTRFLSDQPLTIQDLVEKTNLSEGTIQNVGTDLLMFGLAIRENSKYTLAPELLNEDNIFEAVLYLIREKFRKHIITLNLKDLPTGSNISFSAVIDLMKEVYTESSYADKTWRYYAIRLCRWLEITGFLQDTKEPLTWVYKDTGIVNPTPFEERKKWTNNKFFIPQHSPSLMIHYYEEVKGRKITELPITTKNTKGISILRRFNLVENNTIIDVQSIGETLYQAALKENSIQEGLQIYENFSETRLTSRELGYRIMEIHGFDWTDSTTEYSGKKLLAWVTWIKRIQQIKSTLQVTAQN